MNEEYYEITLPRKIQIKKKDSERYRNMLTNFFYRLLTLVGLTNVYNFIYDKGFKAGYEEGFKVCEHTDSKGVNRDESTTCGHCNQSFNFTYFLIVYDYRNKNNLHSNRYNICEGCYLKIFPGELEKDKDASFASSREKFIEDLSTDQKKILDLCYFITNSSTGKIQYLYGDPDIWTQEYYPDRPKATRIK